LGAADRGRTLIEMSRGKLEDDVLRTIAAELPLINDLEENTLHWAPDVISMAFDPQSSVPGASVCLQDLAGTLAEARFALHEGLAHKIWYSERAASKQEALGIFFMRFFLDDVALRLYSGGEHLAEAIVAMLEIDRLELKPYAEKNRSRWMTVVTFLREKKNDHPVALAASKLAAMREWKKAVNYRNDWVHGQPPLIKGLGIVYKRGQRWTLEDNGSWSLGVGGGDEPIYSVDDLKGFIQPALFALVEITRQVMIAYSAILAGRGLKVSEDGCAAQPGASADARAEENR
jgi:hypothetical protein